MANKPTVKCVAEDDGYHVHEYQAATPLAGRTTLVRVEHHLHSWMDDHKRLYPEVKDFSARGPQYRHLGYWDTIEEAWAALMLEGPVPPVSCRA